jgi:hypothetical protein
MNEFKADDVLVGYTDEQLDEIEDARNADIHDLVEEIRRLNKVAFDALTLLHAAHRELSTIEAITVSPSDTDGLLKLVSDISEFLKPNV